MCVLAKTILPKNNLTHFQHFVQHFYMSKMKNKILITQFIKNGNNFEFTILVLCFHLNYFRVYILSSKKFLSLQKYANMNL